MTHLLSHITYCRTLDGFGGKLENSTIDDEKKKLFGTEKRPSKPFFAGAEGKVWKENLFAAQPRNTPKTDLSALLTILATLNTR